MVIIKLFKVFIALVRRDILNKVYTIRDRKINKELSRGLMEFFSRNISRPDSDIKEKVEESKRNFPFHHACMGGDLCKVKELFQENPDIINVCPEYDLIICRLPIVLALYNGHYDIANFILENGFIPTIDHLIYSDRLYYNFKTFKLALDSVLSKYKLGVNMIFVTDEHSGRKDGLLHSIFSALIRAKNNNELKEVLKSFKYLMGLGLNITDEEVATNFIRMDKTSLAILKMLYIYRIGIIVSWKEILA